MIEFYKAYFERLATLHLRHTPEEKAYFYIKDKYNPKAFDDAIKSAGRTPALLVERYTYDVTDNANRNRFRHINGRFSVLVSATAGDQQSVDAAEDLAEQISTSIILKMADDFGGGGFIALDNGDQQRVFFDINQVPVDPIGPVLQKYYGVTVGFIWKCPLKVSVPSGDWLDIE